MAEYIEREAVREEIASLARERFTLSDIFEAYLDGLKDVDMKIRNLPAADVQPVRHGRWMWRSFNIMCSECDFMPYFDSTEPLYHYCPNCGAKMDGGEE